MGSFASYIPTIASTAMSMASEANKNSAAEDAAAAQAEAQDRQNQNLYQQQAQEQQRQQDLLERALASERARVAAGGLGGGGSADAIMAGMAEDTAQGILASNQAAQGRASRISGRRMGSGGGSLLDTALSPKSLSVFSSFYDNGSPAGGMSAGDGGYGGYGG